MKYFSLFCIVIAMILQCVQVNAAAPLTAPATFSLEGSSIGISCNYRDIKGSTVSAVVTPNPAPVSGYIFFDSINVQTGAFNGKFQDISASVEVEIPAIKRTVQLTTTIESDPVTGTFLWSSDKVIFDTSTILVTLSLGTQTVPIPVSGIRFPATFNGDQITIQVNASQAFTYMGVELVCELNVNLVADMIESSSSLTSPWIVLSSNQTDYFSGQLFKLFASLGNPGNTKDVDIYLALYSPDETYRFFPGYTTDITPLVSNFSLAGGTDINLAKIYEVMLPSSAPPVSMPGAYQFLAAMFEPGTYNIIGELAVVDFTYETETVQPDSFDGIWVGSGESVVVNDVCPDLANVQLTVENNQVVQGWAEATLDGYEYDGYEITGSLDSSGSIVNGFLWEEYKADMIAIGTYEGTFSGTTASGTWQDAYGCYGTFQLIKNPSE